MVRDAIEVQPQKQIKPIEIIRSITIGKVYNLRMDPYERADITSNTYFDWMIDRIWLLIPAQAYVAEMLQTLQEFPARQESASFNIEKLLEKLKEGAANI